MTRARLVVVLSLVLGAALGYLPPPTDDDEPQHHQQQQQQLVAVKPAPDDCSAGCFELESRHRQTQCSDGCALWEQALNSSCQEVCKVVPHHHHQQQQQQRRVSTKELYCAVGCQNAIDRYFQKLKAEIGPTAPTPVLVEDSLAATSLTLRWENSKLKRHGSRVLYFAQWKFYSQDVELEAKSKADWQYCDSQNWNGDNQIFIHNLQPYTKYRFRLAISLSSAPQRDDSPIYSEASSIIMTFSGGPPRSAPVILRAVAVDHSRIYVHWKAGPFTNGPLFSYVLRLNQEAREAFQIKDIPTSQDTFMFQALDPNTNYSVTLSMRNGDGEGPSTSAFVKTLFEPGAGSSSEAPTLVVASELSILRQSSGLDAGGLVELHTSEFEIRDTAVLAAVSQLFLCDSADRILRVSLKAPNTTSLILAPASSTAGPALRPWALSADWLHGWLYVAAANDATGFWEIARCDFDGRQKLRGLVPGLASQPVQLEADPVNGYLFWMTSDGGIYRLDLADFEDQDQDKDVPVKPELILKRAGLGAFAVDYENARLLVTYQSENTIKSVSLDGKVVIDVRLNSKQPRFRNVSSLSMSGDGLLYWTDGDELFAETYESNEYQYFYKVLWKRVDNYFLNVHVLSGSEQTSQPTPFPRLAPTNIQALVLSDRVKISWRVPASASQQGRGAWRNWSYALLLEDDVNKELIQEREIRATEHSVLELRDRALYSLRVAAYSATKDGPWSQEFKVQTLEKNSNASILWSTTEALLQSDPMGGGAEVLLNNTDLDSESPTFVSDVDWYDDLLFVVGNNSRVYRYNLTSRELTSFKHAYPSSCVAVDWLTGKIYWADPTRQIITRANLDGTNEEPVVFSKVVKNLVLDPMEAYLYWSTSRTVEVSRLNGEDRRRYRSEEDFDGRHVAGLTLDRENRFVYWTVGDYVGDFKLYRSLTAEMLPLGPDIAPEMVSVISSITGLSLSYFSNRFFYLASKREAITSDAYGKYVSSLTIDQSNSSVESLFVKTPNPPVRTKINVRPDPVEVSGISIEGTWRDFNLTWKPVGNTDYGRVFYEVTFVDSINVDTQPVSTTRTTVNYANSDRLLPYTLVFVYVRAYTYWDSAPAVSKVLRSPQSVPSQPTQPRVFIESYKDAMAENVDYFATFRWNMPEFENGPITGFKVRCWFVVDNVELIVCDSIDVSASKLEYTIHNLQGNTSYFFQVSAKTEVGPGIFSEPISASSDSENPVPQLLVATMEDVKKVDLDQRSNVTITPHIAVEIAHIAAESKIYWINEMQELVTAGVEGDNITKILTLNNTALSLCVDWISRSLYWTESSYEEFGSSVTYHVMKLDLSLWEAGILKFSRILSRSRRIVNLDVSPLTGSLFWIEHSDSDLGYAIQSDLSGENVQPFFNHTEGCSCSFRPKIRPVFTVDNTEAQSPVIYWISEEGDLNIADIEGCSCSLVLPASVNRGLPPTSLTTDKSYVYWSDMTIHKIHYVNKSFSSEEDTSVKEYPINDVRNILAIGKSLQPYPDSDCLMPQREAYGVRQIAKTSTSITVRLPEPIAYLGCEKYNLPATLYTIDLAECKKVSGDRLYREIDDNDACDNDEERIRYQTYSKEYETRDLKPFTKYRFKLSLSNYYSDQELVSIEQLGPGLVLRTAAGVPSKPDDVRARPLTPTSATVDWVPPMFWNAEYVRYKVFWRGTTTSAPEGEKMVRDGDVSTRIEPLLPGREYRVYVRVYPENFTDVYAQSEETSVVMYAEPNNLTLMGVASDSMNVSWVPASDPVVNHSLEYARRDLESWQAVYEFTRIKNRLIYMVRDLSSKEFYKFRLVLRYRNYTENFIWPNDDRFTFQTLEDIPTAPGTPTLVNLQNSNYQLRWEPARSHGSQTISYELEGAVVDSSLNFRYDWSPMYNGTENTWELPNVMHEKYLFRARARNDYGHGNWSEVSSVVDLTEMTRAIAIAQEHLGLILGLCVPIVTAVLLCFCYFLCPLNKKPNEDQKKTPIKMTKPKVELATLREIPRGNFVEANALYVAATESDSGDSLLPKIPRDQISLAKFLGSGAFGEVFQGVVRDLDGAAGSKTPIAVKTLRKGASPQEKNEFIQEAKLMSHFKHKHVLRLLGVCLDTDPPLMLLELMASDLLSYLRHSRSLKASNPSALRLQDLLAICEDVARGCQYLEELHFVHRDIACRNCLVSARERQHRVVKIGDFGLARDIYKNDYYRKEGEGLLPVRWMAPESLIDGVFTSQSDVWAFGVLMWEVTSLGQQPYQARTNLEVLHHVRAGGRLPKPLNCPPRLHQLMLRCWSTVDARPSFKVCLDHIVALRNCIDDTALSPVNPGQFLVHGNAYKSSHFRDNLSIQSLLQDPNSPKPPAVGPKHSSWLLDGDDDDDALESNESKDPRAAYEVPKSIPVVVESADSEEKRYIEICSATEDSPEKSTDDADDVDRNRVSVTSLTLSDKKLEQAPPLRSSTISLGDKYKFADGGLKQSGSYAKLVGNGESVSSLSDWRRVKRMASGDENSQREKSGGAEDAKGTGPSLLSYSMISFAQTADKRPDGQTTKTALPNLHRSKSNLQTSKSPNIPLVINSGLLNMLRRENEESDEGDDVNYANIDPDIVTVTDL